MKNILLISLLLISSISFGARSEGGLLNYSTVVDISANKGKTFFALMQDVVKPALDEYATEGFIVADGKTVIAALKNVETKVSAKAIRAAGSQAQLKKLADELHDSGEKITFYDLPQAIADAGVSAGRYDLSTFLALVSGGGVALKINDDNFAYNVNYGTGEFEKDEMTGRSFGEAPGRLALDASDKHYLQILEKYVRTEGENSEEFYLSLMQILLNSDASNYENISEAGQAVASDFIAVYTAEQDRHLMAELKNHHWDEALLEVTLLSAFHGGQKNVMVMYDGQLTDTTLAQSPGCNEEERSEKRASMIDYWQFSTSNDPANCNRSGINITRRDFRALGAMISDYQRENNPELVENVERHFKGIKTGGNVFAELSDFLINFDTPKKLDKKTQQLAQDFTAFLMQVRKDANKMSSHIIEVNNK
ncbi:hypothetical protein K2P97_12650 [bacterium]|nr:hypothetical protein [bacterium]